jgi:hypothetical protein
MKAAPSIFFAALLGGLLVTAPPMSATVTVEFQFGGVNVPAGSIGVLAADTTGNGFATPTDFPGTLLGVGEAFGDDVIVAVLTQRDLPEWGARRGFADLLAVLDYEALGVAEGNPLVLHVFPDRSEGQPVRSGEPHLPYRSEDLGDITPNSTIGFALPRDGGAHLLAVLGPENGGTADLDEVDLTALPGASSGSMSRDLSATGRHTYFLELTVPGLLRLNGGPVPGLRAELYGPDGALIAVSEGRIDIIENLGVGFHSLVIFRPGGGAASYSFQFADSDSRVVVPDVSVGPRANAPVGAGRVGGAPGQVANVISPRARRMNGFARVANLGDRPDRIAVRGTRGTAFCAVAYFAPGNVTAAMLGAAGHRSPRELVQGGAPHSIRVQFTPNRRRLVRKVGRREVTARRTFPATLRAAAVTQSATPDAATLRLLTR